MRTPVFELHILPLFRATDQEHMKSQVDLWDYDKVVENRDLILEALETNMPPGSFGGPWPQEWIELFRRWADGIRKRLELGTAQYEFSATATTASIKATGTFPAADYKGWLQLESQTTTARTYVLYFEPPDTPATGPSDTFTVRERFRPANGEQSTFVHDATGVHKLG